MGAASMYTRARSSVDAGGFPCVRFIDCNGHELEDPQLDNCHPIRCALSPALDSVPCDAGGGPCCDATNEGLEAILEAIEALELPEAAGVSQIGCVREDPADSKTPVTGIVLACKNADGSLRYVMKPVDGGELVDPYDGPFSTDCGSPEFLPLNCFVADPDSPHCGAPLFECLGQPYVFDANGEGWILIDPETTDLSNTFKPATTNTDEKWAKEDLTPYMIDGAAGPLAMADIFADALAASDVVDFAATPCDILEEHVSRCGAVSITEIDGNAGVQINDLPAQAVFNDVDGVNMANTLTVPAGCRVIVSFCARKEYVPTKIPVVTREDGENITLSDPPDVQDGDTVEFTDSAGTLISSSTVASGAGSSQLVLTAAPATAVKGTFLKRVAAEGKAG